MHAEYVAVVGWAMPNIDACISEDEWLAIEEQMMKVPMIVLVGTLLALMGGCQSDMSGPPSTPDETITAPPSVDSYPDVPVGDAYFESTIGRNELGGK
jgi:hypothetical protein